MEQFRAQSPSPAEDKRAQDQMTPLKERLSAKRAASYETLKSMGITGLLESDEDGESKTRIRGILNGNLVEGEITGDDKSYVKLNGEELNQERMVKFLSKFQGAMTNIKKDAIDLAHEESGGPKSTYTIFKELGIE